MGEGGLVSVGGGDREKGRFWVGGEGKGRERVGKREN